ncbi:MAG: SDR family NAD(P)-dependent oxidoreductase [Candidatus Nitrosocaldus sp.]|nr:SDR family NAD(P)-dependent oxidoreductase [Candidatus Nitrosocaldus sp.]MDW8276097.1 SDR family NAD(P)-dependent oxidoreductase [Candidatus Nitrosocaldus sp.]
MDMGSGVGGEVEGEGRCYVVLVSNMKNGIGVALSSRLADMGIATYALHERSYVHTPHMRMVAMEGDVEECISTIAREARGIDALINLPAYAQLGTIEDITVGELVEQFSANLFHTFRLIRAVVPVMRLQGRGMIINVTSLAGIMGFPAITAFSSSMFALEGLSECLRYELMQYGIDVVLVEPGAVRSDRDLLRLPRSGHSDMLKTVHRGLAHLIEHGLSEDDVADTITRIIEEHRRGSRPRMRYIVGDYAFAMLEAKRSMGEDEFEELVRRDVGLDP